MNALIKLKEKLAQLTSLNQIGRLLSWDQDTYLPNGGVSCRSMQFGALSEVIHELQTGETMTRLIGQARELTADLPDDHLDKQLVRMVAYNAEIEKKLPTDFVVEMGIHFSNARTVWGEAREKNDYALFEPLLKKNIELVRREADYIGYDQEPYDALLGMFEPKMSTAQVRRLFSDIRPPLEMMLQKVMEKGRKIDKTVLNRRCPISVQEQACKIVANLIGYDFFRGRLDSSGTTAGAYFIGRSDSRIVTRYHEDIPTAALMIVLHEAGHAMYNQNIGEELEYSSLDYGASMALHESQSRLWENIIGRSRPFWRALYPRLHKLAPDIFPICLEDDFYSAINLVEPSFTRTTADELTYNLHIFLRFELEIELVSGRLNVHDLPAAFNERMAVTTKPLELSKASMALIRKNKPKRGL
jgi:carboxypeptidase Taq